MWQSLSCVLALYGNAALFKESFVYGGLPTYLRHVSHLDAFASVLTLSGFLKDRAARSPLQNSASVAKQWVTAVAQAC